METKSFTPVWHPSAAGNCFTLYNNVNKTNNILYYDSTGAFISYPKVFTYNRTDSTNNFKLTKVTTNSNSDNPTYSNTLPSTSGTFTINKIAPNSGNSAPSIDLYCSGEIQFANTKVSDGGWDLDSHSWVTLDSYSVSPSIYDSGSSNYNLNQQLVISYHTTSSFISSNWVHSQFWIKFTANWGKDSNGNYIVAQSANNQGPMILYPPATFIPDVTPTLTVWIRQYAKQSGGGGGDTPEEHGFKTNTSTWIVQGIAVVSGYQNSDGSGTSYFVPADTKFPNAEKQGRYYKVTSINGYTCWTDQGSEY